MMKTERGQKESTLQLLILSPYLTQTILRSL